MLGNTLLRATHTILTPGLGVVAHCVAFPVAFNETRSVLQLK
jgi:hypothetical protein